MYSMFDVIAQICNIICYTLNINLKIPNENISEKSAFESGLLFLTETLLFSNSSFFLNLCQTLIPECAY